MKVNLGGMQLTLNEGTDIQDLILNISDSGLKFFPEEERKYFDYSEASLAAVDEAISLLWPNKPPQRIHETTAMWGSYVGETFRRLLDGQWVVSDSDDKFLMLQVLTKPNPMTISPYGKVFRRFQNGMEDSIGGFFDSVKKVIRLAIICPETYVDKLSSGHVDGVTVR